MQLIDLMYDLQILLIRIDIAVHRINITLVTLVHQDPCGI